MLIPPEPGIKSTIKIWNKKRGVISFWGSPFNVVLPWAAKCHANTILECVKYGEDWGLVRHGRVPGHQLILAVLSRIYWIFLCETVLKAEIVHLFGASIKTGLLHHSFCKSCSSVHPSFKGDICSMAPGHLAMVRIYRSFVHVWIHINFAWQRFLGKAVLSIPHSS